MGISYDNLQPKADRLAVRYKSAWSVKERTKRAINEPSILQGFAWEVEKLTTHKPKGPTTTEDAVIFEPGGKVSLDIPDRLFGSSFNLITNLSTTVGDFITNSAVRTQRLLESMRPFLRRTFGSKGIVIEGPTDKPIFSDPKESSS
ncbi:unnamed protein product [Acanthoscelides obtectus]|uniref:Uncharacterized protein n=1 Tax=Acanthoscelides obtectus TaxID=200917 RepID=A0A9P0M6M9_ACAOB|nr:unnamed protein product [Acanthoscelides obtectus]CAK1646260.1 hypothetical protein AOBTE_LOCUS14537 [Acanthoscelides obtectus]